MSPFGISRKLRNFVNNHLQTQALEFLPLYSESLDGHFINQAVEALRNGEIIICPTDTLYALACNALNQRAIERLCQIKGLNPDKNYLSVVCSDISQASEYARIDNRAFQILREYLPGPFTFILPASSKLPKVFKGRKTVGVRIPDSAVARALAEALGNPLLTTSVDPYDDSDPDGVVNPELIAEKYENDASVLIDAGEGRSVPSTVVDLTDSANPQVVRQGLGEL